MATFQISYKGVLIDTLDVFGDEGDFEAAAIQTLYGRVVPNLKVSREVPETTILSDSGVPAP